MYLKIFNYEVSSFRWITIVSLSTFVFFAAGGILSLPYVILPEILPQKVNLIHLKLFQYLNCSCRRLKDQWQHYVCSSFGF